MQFNDPELFRFLHEERIQRLSQRRWSGIRFRRNRGGAANDPNPGRNPDRGGRGR